VLRDYLTDLLPDHGAGYVSQDAVDRSVLRAAVVRDRAGGSAPKHVEQFQHEGYLRGIRWANSWRFGASLEHLAQTTGVRT